MLDKSPHVQNLIGGCDLTPSQWSDLYRQVVDSPEKDLAFAVFCDAILTLQRSNASRLPFREAVDWVTSERFAGPFAFESICETLGFDVDCWRGKLLAIANGSARVRVHTMHERPSEIRRHAR